MKILVLFLSVALSAGQQVDQTQNLRTDPESLRFQGSFTSFSSGNEAQLRNGESGSSSGFYFDSSATNPHQGEGWTFKTYDSSRSESSFASGGLPDGRAGGSEAASGGWKGAISQGVYVKDSDSTPNNRNGFQDPASRNNQGLSGVQGDSTTGPLPASGGFSSSGTQGSEVLFGSSEGSEFHRNLPSQSESFSLQEQPNNVKFPSGSLRDHELQSVASEPLSKDGEVRGISPQSGVIKIDSSNSFRSQSSPSVSGFAQPQNNEFQLKSSQFQPASLDSSSHVTSNQFDSSFTGNFGPRAAVTVNDGSTDAQNGDGFLSTEQNRYPVGPPHQSKSAFHTESANVGGFQSSVESSLPTGSFPNDGFSQISKGVNEFGAGSTSSGGFASAVDSFESQFTSNNDGIKPAFGNSLFVFNSNNRVFPSSLGSSGLKISTSEIQGDPIVGVIQAFANNNNGFELDSNNSETSTSNADFDPTSTGRQSDSGTGEFDSNFSAGVQEGGFGSSGIQNDFSDNGSLEGNTASADIDLRNAQSESDASDSRFKTSSDSNIEKPELSNSQIQSDIKSSRLEVVTELSRIQFGSGSTNAQFGQSSPEVNGQKTSTGSSTLQTGTLQIGIGENNLQTNSKLQAGNSGFQFSSQSSSQNDAGSRPQSNAGSRFQFGTGSRPQTESGINLFGTGSKTQSGTGGRFQLGTSSSQSSFGGSAGSSSKTGSGSTFQTGSGSQSISGSQSQIDTGSRSQTASGSRFQFGTGRGSQSPTASRSPLSLVSSHFGTGTKLQSSSGSGFQFGTGRGSQSTPAGRSQPGTGSRSQTIPGSSHFGTGTRSHSISGNSFQFGTGSGSQSTSGGRFHFGTGSRTQLNAGSGSRATSGSQFGTGGRAGSAGISHFSLSRPQTPSGRRLQFSTGSRFQSGAGSNRPQATLINNGFQTSSGNKRVQSNSRFTGSRFGAQGSSANTDSRTNAFQSGSKTQPTSGRRIQSNSQFGAGTSKVNVGNSGFQFGTGISTTRFSTRNRVPFGTGSRSGSSNRFQSGSSGLQSSFGSTGTSGLGINRFQSSGSRLVGPSGSFGSNTRLQNGSGRVGIQAGLADRLKTESANSQDGVFEPLNLPAEATKLLGRISTSFTCQDRPYGYYADKENSCRVFHVCYPARFESGDIETSQYSFLCSEGSVFDQRTLACVPETDAIPCQESSNFFFTNEQFGLPIDKLN